jgi:hypothetical protein
VIENSDTFHFLEAEKSPVKMETVLIISSTLYHCGNHAVESLGQGLPGTGKVQTDKPLSSSSKFTSIVKGDLCFPKKEFKGIPRNTRLPAIKPGKIGSFHLRHADLRKLLFESVS